MSNSRQCRQPTSPDLDLLFAALTGLAVGLCLGGDWSRLAALLELVIGR